MFPAKPPFPSPRYFPFQPLSGSQTSILISESWAGLMVACTRQNAGRFLTEAGGALAPGGINCPAATSCAEVMVVSGRLSLARLSHEARPAAETKTKNRAISMQVLAWRARVTVRPPGGLCGRVIVNQNGLPYQKDLGTELVEQLVTRILII